MRNDYFGIDLGTSNCLVARVSKDWKGNIVVSTLEDTEGNKFFPSIIKFESKGSYKVGNSIIDGYSSDPTTILELIKIRMGKTSTVKIKTKDDEIVKTPQEISSFFLSHCQKIYDVNIEEAVITVPAYFDQGQKDATMQAGMLASIRPMQLIEEPTAAIMYHIYSRFINDKFNFFEGKTQKNILVFDFGGGTLDLSLIGLTLVENQVIPKVLATGGDPQLGGNTIDLIFTKIVIDILVKKHPNDSFIKAVSDFFEDYYKFIIFREEMLNHRKHSDDVKGFVFRLKRRLEAIKIKLSNNLKEKIVFERDYEPIEITRENFEKRVLMNEELNIKESIMNALGAISKERIPVAEVLLVGGSSQIPLIKEIIFQAFGALGITRGKINISDDFSEAVAKGAAIQAAIINGLEVPPFYKNKCMSIISRDILVKNSGKSEVFINRGTEYPFQKPKEFKLNLSHSLSESIGLKFQEKLNIETKEFIEICDFKFYLPFFYTNDEIILRFNVNEAGLYQIDATHLMTNESIEFEPIKPYSLSEIELEKVKKENLKLTDVS